MLNGEIYNFAELRADLEARGHVFRTNGDAETLVHLYEESGLDCTERLNGMFAFAVWDTRRRRLLLARDRLGKKPLYYAELDGGLLFASELKALLQHPACPRDLDRAALEHYLAFEYVPSPHAIFSGIRKLPPGHRLVWEQGRTSVEPYWDLRFDGTRYSTGGRDRRGVRGAPARGRSPPPRQRRAAGRLPQRRHRLELHRRLHVRPAAARAGADVLDRLHRAELRRVRARAGRCAALPDAASRGDLHSERPARRPAGGHGGPRRAVRRPLRAADVPPLPLRTGDGDGRAGRRRWGRAARRLSDVPRGSRRSALCAAARPPRAGRRAAGRAPARLD